MPAPARTRRGLAWIALAVLLAGLPAAGGGWWFGSRANGVLPEIRQITVRRGTIDAARFSSAGDSVVYSARFGGGVTAPYETHLNSPEARQIGPDNSMLLAASQGGLALGLEPRLSSGRLRGTLATLLPGASVAREIFVFNRDALPARVHRVDFRTGERRLEHEFRPADPAGIAGIPTVVMSADGTIIAFNYWRVLSTLYEVRGLAR